MSIGNGCVTDEKMGFYHRIQKSTKKGNEEERMPFYFRLCQKPKKDIQYDSWCSYLIRILFFYRFIFHPYSLSPTPRCWYLRSVIKYSFFFLNFLYSFYFDWNGPGAPNPQRAAVGKVYRLRQTKTIRYKSENENCLHHI